MKNPTNAGPSMPPAWQSANDSIAPLPCVLVRVPDEPHRDGEFVPEELLMACIPHRKDRLPVQFQAQIGLCWRCADGKLEELAIGRDHPDWIAVWQEIEGPGLLVCEMPGGEAKEASTANLVSVIAPIGHWVLTKDGSQEEIFE